MSRYVILLVDSAAKVQLFEECLITRDLFETVPLLPLVNHRSWTL